MRRVVRTWRGPVGSYQHGQDLRKVSVFGLIKGRLRGIQQHPTTTGRAVTELVPISGRY